MTREEAKARWARQQAEKDQHAAEMRNKHLSDDIPEHVAGMTYSRAYEEGHASGWEAIDSAYADLSPLVEKAFQAGRDYPEQKD